MTLARAPLLWRPWRALPLFAWRGVWDKLLVKDRLRQVWGQWSCGGDRCSSDQQGEHWLLSISAFESFGVALMVFVVLPSPCLWASFCREQIGEHLPSWVSLMVVFSSWTGDMDLVQLKTVTEWLLHTISPFMSDLFSESSPAARLLWRKKHNQRPS